MVGGFAQVEAGFLGDGFNRAPRKIGVRVHTRSDRGSSQGKFAKMVFDIR